MKRTFIEKILVAAAWLGLIFGILFTVLVSKGIFESNQEMCFPQAIVTLVGGVAAFIVGWALLLQIVRISDKLHIIEKMIDDK